MAADDRLDVGIAQDTGSASSSSRRRPRRVTCFVVYLRVSTLRQGASGLGIVAQREAVARRGASTGGRILAEVVETESGKQNTRPQLARALGICRGQRATLLIAKLDWLARNVHFISGLMETGVPFVAADMPTATPFMLHIYSTRPWRRRRGSRFSTRTKAALAAAKARGVKLGNPRLLAGSPDQARMAAAAKSAKATARATDLPPGDRRGPGRRRRYAERDRQGVDGAGLCRPRAAAAPAVRRRVMRLDRRGAGRLNTRAAIVLVEALRYRDRRVGCIDQGSVPSRNGCIYISLCRRPHHAAYVASC
jgi:DNA invertase Pin-like site-specific DNA recombinase